MSDLIPNSTLGPITRERLTELRREAKSCARCGMLATVDPVFHGRRYGHTPIIRSADGILSWTGSAWEPVANA